MAAASFSSGKTPSLSFAKTAMTSVHDGLAAAASLTAEENTVIARFLSASHKLESTKAKKAAVMSANSSLFGGGSATSAAAAVGAAKSTLQKYMQEAGIDILLLKEGHVMRANKRRPSGIVKVDAIATMMQRVLDSKVRVSIFDVLNQAAGAMEKAAAKPVRTGAKRHRGARDRRFDLFDSVQDAAADTKSCVGGDDDASTAPPSGAVDRPRWSASSVASSARSSVASSVQEAVAGSVKRATAKYGKATGVDTDKIMRKLVSNADCAAAAGALDMKPRSKASFIGEHEGGDLDVATALSEAIFQLVNPVEDAVSLTKNLPKDTEELVVASLEIGECPDADERVHDAAQIMIRSREMVSQRTADKKAASKAKAGIPEDGDTALLGDDVTTVDGYSVASAAVQYDTVSVVDAGGAPELKGADAARRDISSLSTSVHDIIKKKGVDSLTLRTKTPGGAFKSISLSAKPAVDTVEKLTWSRFAHALRGAVAASLTDGTDVDPDLPCGELLSKDPTVIARITDQKVLFSIMEAVRVSVEVFHDAHTVQYGATGVVDNKPKPRSVTAYTQAKTAAAAANDTSEVRAMMETGYTAARPVKPAAPASSSSSKQRGSSASSKRRVEGERSSKRARGSSSSSSAKPSLKLTPVPGFMKAGASSSTAFSSAK
jgi:hypothetical protein